MKNDYYVYIYLREDDTPYYVGKGCGKRAFKFSRRNIRRPPTDDKINILVSNLTEQQAFEYEKYFIAKYGRKDKGTGVLHNKTDGGEGTSGTILTEKQKILRSEKTKGRICINDGKRNRFIEKNTKIPRGWKLGVFYDEERKENIRNSQKNRWKNLSEQEKKDWVNKVNNANKDTLRKPMSDKVKNEIKKRFTNSIYITNGIDNRRIMKNDIIPLGWTKGRVTKTPRSKKTIEKQRESIKKTLAKKREKFLMEKQNEWNT